ncbi:MAG: zinc ribbon domain-containing protein [Methanomassiliicoccales archaeon]|nr:zinc ribbon domain-containing protein [Methanomassiliicoccales archaeon]
MSVLDEFNEKMKGIRQSKMAVPLGMVLAILVTVFLTVISYLWVSQILCLLPMLVALLAYGIPTYFGLKDRRKLSVFGLGLFMIVGVSLGAALYTTIDNYQGEPISSDDNALIAGSVSPAQGVPGDGFTFTVTSASPSINETVYVILINNWGTAGEDRNLTMSTSSDPNATVWVYSLAVNDLDEGIYYFQFGLIDDGHAVTTDQTFGPVNADMGTVLTNSMLSGIMVAFMNMAVLFYILVLLTWWMDRSKKKIFEMEQKRGKPKEKKAVDEKFVCSDCGADVPASADKCPSCGAKFDDEGELKCPQCAAKILKSDTKCWNCGKQL